MKQNTPFLIFITIVLIAMIRASIVQAAEIPLSSCPAAVQETIRSHQHGGILDDVKLISIEGRSLYVAEVELPGDRDLRIHITSDGSLIKTREEISLKQAPAAVQEAVSSLMPAGSRLDDVYREVATGKTTFRVEFDRPQARDLNLHLAEDGTLLNQREDS